MARLVLISCASGAFRRAGFTFGHDPLLVDLDELSDGAVDAIESEELLTIAEATEEDVARLSGPPIDMSATRSPDEIEALNGTIDQLEQELKGVRDELSTANSAVSSLTTERDAARAEADALRADLAETRGKLGAAEERVSELEALKLEDVALEGADQVELVPPPPAGAMTTPAAPVSSAGKKKAGGKS
jgi:regulator of replication initiation timing